MTGTLRTRLRREECFVRSCWTDSEVTRAMPGVGISVLLLAIGAILDFGVTVSPYQHGFNVNNVGIILMVVGAVGLRTTLVWPNPRPLRLDARCLVSKVIGASRMVLLDVDLASCECLQRARRDSRSRCDDWW
jgi:hypothetical protein